uniref:Tetratricopeptide repeat protein n=1 Tax=candidate division WOR-3 bacterium TaxID=2052148 RepID=A0A7V4AB69_UNCW3
MIFFLLFSLLFSEEEIKKVEYAEILFHEGLYENAIEYYKSLKNTNLGKAMELEFDYRIGECYFNLGKYDEAYKIFKNLENRAQNSYILPEVYYALGLIFIAQENPKQAEDYLIQKMKKFPGYAEDIRLLEAQGIYYFTQAIYESAYKKLENALTGVGIFYKGEALARLKRPVEALQNFKKVVMLYPNTPLAEYASFEAAEALYINEDYRGAKELYIRFIKDYGKSPLVDYANYKIGACLFHEGEYAKSLLYFKPLLKHQDRILSAHAYLMCGKALREIGNKPEALKYLLKAAFDFPGTGVAPVAHMELGKTYLEIGDSAQAIISYRQLANVYNTGEYKGIGDYLTACVLYRQGKTLEAQYQLESLLKYAKNTFIAYPATSLLLKCMIDTKQFDEAIAAGEEFLSSTPQNLDEEMYHYISTWTNRIRHMLAEAYYQRQDVAKAINLYESLSESGDPEIMGEIFNALGWCYIETKRYDAAIQKFDVVISGYQKDTSAVVSAIFGKGVAIYDKSGDIQNPEEKKKNYLQAAYTFKSIAQTYPSHSLTPASLFYTGESYARAGYYANAIKEWEACLNDFPESPYAALSAYWLGNTYFRAGEFDKAITYYSVLLEQYPTSQKAKDGFVELAATYYNMKNYDMTVNVLKKFLSLYPEDSLAVNAKKLLEQAYYFVSKEDAEKIEEYSKEFPESELLAENLYNLAAKLYNEKKYEEAIEKAKKVILLFPKSELAPMAQKVVVASYSALGNSKAMAEEAEKFVTYFPNHEEVPVMLKLEAIGLIQQENYLKAKDVLEVLIKNYSMHPASKEGIILKAECLLNLGKTREAIRDLESQSPSPEVATRYYYILGESYNKIGNTQKAIENYSSLLRVGGMDDPYRIRGLYQLAYLYQLSGDTQRAASIYEAIAQVTSDKNIKEDALGRASALRK